MRSLEHLRRPVSRLPFLARRGFTLLEVLFVIILMMIILGGLLSFFSTGAKSVVLSTDHAVARDEAISVLHAIGQDMDRIIIADDFDRMTFPNVVEPILIRSAPQGSSFMFYGFHHRVYHWQDHRMELVGNRIEYQVRPIEPGNEAAGVNLYRNDEDSPINRIPLQDVLFEMISVEEAEQLSISPFHAVRVIIKPKGIWDKNNTKLSELHPQTRLFHMKGIESQFAVLLSLKESGAGAYYQILSDPRLKVPDRLAVYSTYKLDQVPLDWMRPRGIVTLEDEFYDYETAGNNAETGTPGTPVPIPTATAPTGCPHCTACGTLLSGPCSGCTMPNDPASTCPCGGASGTCGYANCKGP